MKTLFLILLALIFLGLVWIRLAPIDRDRWHTDPAETDEPGQAGVRFIGQDAPRYPADPETVLATIKDIALSDPRTRLLEGGVDEGMMTFVVRSKVFGFADFVTVKAVSEGRLTKMSIASRARASLIGGNDWGVNAARVDRWLQDMRLRLGEG